jgi:transposase
VRAPQGSIVDGVEPRIRELLQAWPTMPATVIAERLGWDRGLTVLKDRVRELRPAYLPVDPASRTAYLAGEVAQFDLWFAPVEMPVGFGQTRTSTQLPVLVGVTGYARWLAARLIPSRCAEDLLAGWWQLLEGLGAIPRVLVWDGEGAVGRWQRGRSELTEACQAFRGVLGAKVVICPPADPEANAYAERWVGTVRREVRDRLLIVGCRQLRLVLAEYVDHYNVHRPHRSLGQAPPLGPGESAVVVLAGRVVRRDRLGGLIHEYAQVA